MPDSSQPICELLCSDSQAAPQAPEWQLLVPNFALPHAAQLSQARHPIEHWSEH
jgi:hypothetical protein